MREGYPFTQLLLEYVTAIHRLTAGACKAGGLCMLSGATMVAAEHLGVEHRESCVARGLSIIH